MRDNLRVSDADRDRATAQLGDHFAAGRLTLSELDDRLGAALTARTSRDLKRALADLPLPRNEQLELRYRRLLALYPARYRRVHQDEILAVLMTAAPADQVRPALADAVDLVIGALRVRYQLLRSAGMTWRRAVALTVAGGMLGVLAGTVIALASPPLSAGAATVIVSPLAGSHPALVSSELAETLSINELSTVLERAASRLGPDLSLSYLRARTHTLLITDRIVEFQVQAGTASLAVQATAAVTASYLALLANRWSPQTASVQVLDPAVLIPAESLHAEIARDAGVAAAFSVLVAASGSLVLVLVRPRRIQAT